MSVLVCVGCPNKILEVGGLNNQICLTLLESGNSKIKVLADLISDRALFLLAEAGRSSLCPHMASPGVHSYGEEWTPYVSSYNTRALIPS